MIESLHVIALTLVFGTILIVDLRLLGLASADRPFGRITSDILRWTWTAFALTVVTGGLMFVTNAQVYYHNTYFRVKLLLLALSGLNMFAFEWTIGRRVRQWEGERSAPLSGRTAAAVSLLLWMAVIVTGRLIGFTTTRAAAKDVPPAATVNFDDFLSPGNTPPAPPADK